MLVPVVIVYDICIRWSDAWVGEKPNENETVWKRFICYELYKLGIFSFVPNQPRNLTYISVRFEKQYMHDSFLYLFEKISSLSR